MQKLKLRFKHSEINSLEDQMIFIESFDDEPEEEYEYLAASRDRSRCNEIEFWEDL